MSSIIDTLNETFARTTAPRLIGKSHFFQLPQQGINLAKTCNYT